MTLYARGDLGSSPLTRGKRRDHAGRWPVLGLIPAHAGKTSSWTWPTTWWPAHPRSRGENLAFFAIAFLCQGSSPLTRGKQHTFPSMSTRTRLIPAHAGKTCFILTHNCNARAHPRSRGENFVADYAALKAWGSSPLTRGKPARWCPSLLRVRLIPAHAGKTPVLVVREVQAWAHPRSRGENTPARSPAFSSTGSSPLTRGKPHVVVEVAGFGGLIPAHAGKTPTGPGCGEVFAAHPRSRGENLVEKPNVVAGLGSSPLTRGKHFLTCAFIAQIDQILESLELCAFSESYSSQDVYATDAPRDRVRSIGLAPRSSRGAS